MRAKGPLTSGAARLLYVVWIAILAAGCSAVKIDAPSFVASDIEAPKGVSIVTHGFSNAEFWSNTGSPTISWTNDASDSMSGVSQIQLAIGTGTSGAALTDGMNWIDVKTITSFSASSLNLSNNVNYYANMRVVDGAGNATVTSSLPWKAIQVHTLNLYQKDAGYVVIPGGGSASFVYTVNRGQLGFTFTGTNLAGMSLNGVNMSLIYYPDPYPGTDLLCLAQGTVSGGTLSLSGDVNLGRNLPYPVGGSPGDTNGNLGAKIWLVRTQDIRNLNSTAGSGSSCTHVVGSTNATRFRINSWNNLFYLFEDNLIEVNFTDADGI